MPSTTPTQGILYSPQFRSHNGPRIDSGRPIELNDPDLRSHGKIGDCEQSTYKKFRTILIRFQTKKRPK